MNISTMIVTVLGLCLFEVVSSIDNAVINAQVLETMGPKGKKWFMLWGFIFAVLVVRGLLPWLIIWLSTPGLGPIQAFLAAFSGNPAAAIAIAKTAPMLLAGGGTFLMFLFLHWLFLEEKEFGLPHERFFARQGAWFYASVSVLLAVLAWYAGHRDFLLAFGIIIGSSAFFITHGFKQNAEAQEKNLTAGGNLSDMAKIVYLEIIDATFSIDGVLGAFAFTLSIPLIIIGNGLGAFILRKLTLGNIDRIKKYTYLKNGAMYSIFVLGIIMVAEGFGVHIHEWVSPLVTFAIIGYFLWKSTRKAA